MKRWNLDPAITEALDYIILKHPEWKATTVYKKLEEEFKGKKDILLPSLRTVQSYVRAHRRSDSSGNWVPTDWPGEDAVLVLEALADFRQGIEGLESYWLTVQEAERILWVRKAAPTLPGLGSVLIAQYYDLYESRQDTTEALSWVIALGPWANRKAHEFYFDAVNNGKIPRAPDSILTVMSMVVGDNVRNPGFPIPYDWLENISLRRQGMDLLGKQSAEKVQLESPSPLSRLVLNPAIFD